jgi:carboxyl-terminal processing protease
MEYGQVKLTRSKFYRISGASTQHRGVIPDITFPDFYDAFDDIGESSLDGALPWDTVKAVEYSPYHAIPALLPELTALHKDRAAESPDFIYLADSINRSKELRNREQLSLNEAVVKADRDANEKVEFEAENMRRLLKGLPLREPADDADESEDETALASVVNDDVSSAEAEPEEVEEGDPLLLESGRILADFMFLNESRLGLLGDLVPTI